MIETPVKIQDHVSPIHTSRKMFHHNLARESQDKNKSLSHSLSKSDFTFKKFLTDKQRVEELNKKTNSAFYKSAYNSIGSAAADNSSNRSTAYNDNFFSKSIASNTARTTNIYMQPTMRFKARTDLERIFDVINDYNFGSADRAIVEKQLKSLNLNQFKKFGPMDNVISYSHIDNKLRVNETVLRYLIEERKKMEKNHQNEEILNTINKIIKINEKLLLQENTEKEKAKLEEKNYNQALENKFYRKKLLNNQYAKKMMKNYHVKTHFQAANVFSLGLNTKPNKIDEKVNLLSINMDNENLQLYSTDQSPKKKQMRSSGFINNKLKYAITDRKRKINHEDSITDEESDHSDTLTNRKPQKKKKFNSIDYNNYADKFFDITYNPLKKEHSEVENVDTHALDYLKKISASSTLMKIDSMKNIHYHGGGRNSFLSKLKRNKGLKSVLKFNPLMFFESYGAMTKIMDEDKKGNIKYFII